MTVLSKPPQPPDDLQSISGSSRGGARGPIVKVCRLCLHCSTEENPLVLGPHARGSIWPTWPWLYGTSECPEGCCCRLCFFVWEYAGFRVQYKTLMIYVQAMKVSSTLTDEHVACLQVVICKTNSGIIKQRLRGGKKGRVRRTHRVAEGHCGSH